MVRLIITKEGIHMRKRNVISFILGAAIFGTVGLTAGQFMAEKNIYPVQINGENVDLDGYNINGNTYFKLREISNVVGGFDVDFFNNTIQLSKDNYKYDNKANEIDYSKYQGTYAVLNGSSKIYNDLCDVLTIKSISADGVDFEFEYQKTGRGVVFSPEKATFVEPYHAIAGGTYSYGGMEIGKIINTNYDLKFDENNIRIIIYFDSQDEPIKDVTYNIMTDRKN